jgi:hypothetical protein
VSKWYETKVTTTTVVVVEVQDDTNVAEADEYAWDELGPADGDRYGDYGRFLTDNDIAEAKRSADIVSPL